MKTETDCQDKNNVDATPGCLSTELLREYWNEWKPNKYSMEQLAALSFIHFIEEERQRQKSLHATNGCTAPVASATSDPNGGTN